MANHAAGISVITFIIAVAISFGYYQFLYLPQVNAKPILPPAVLKPAQTTAVQIVEGAQLQSSPRHFVPDSARAVIGLSNKVVWTNHDTTFHSVTSDDGYKDKINGLFDSNDKLGTLIGPGKTFDFTFTKTGDYAYHCVPHPFMKGKVSVVGNFA